MFTARGFSHVFLLIMFCAAGSFAQTTVSVASKTKPRIHLQPKQFPLLQVQAILPDTQAANKAAVYLQQLPPIHKPHITLDSQARLTAFTYMKRVTQMSPLDTMLLFYIYGTAVDEVCIIVSVRNNKLVEYVVKERDEKIKEIQIKDRKTRDLYNHFFASCDNVYQGEADFGENLMNCCVMYFLKMVNGQKCLEIAIPAFGTSKIKKALDEAIIEDIVSEWGAYLY